MHQISTIGGLEICTSASAAKGNVEKAYLQKMLVIHITVYHHLQDGGRNGVRRPQGISGSDYDFRVDIVGHRIQRQGKAGMARNCIYVLSSPFFPEMFPPSSQVCLYLRQSSRLSVQKSVGYNDFEAAELNTHASDT